MGHGKDSASRIRAKMALEGKNTVYPGPAVVSQPVGATTVVIQQPNMAERDWSSGLCSCLEDVPCCIFQVLCGGPPCMIAEMKLASDMGENVCLPHCVPGAMIALRVKMRHQNKIRGSICDDCLMTACCSPCAACQLVREHKYVKKQQGGAPRAY